MAWPYDDPGVMPDFLMGQGATPAPAFQQGAPAMAEPEPDADLMALLQNPPQEQMPEDFFSRLAMGTGGQGIGMPQFGPRPTGLEVLLQALAGFANAKTRQAGTRISATDQRNAQAREAAKTLATWRHGERKTAAEAADRKAALAQNQSFQRDQLKIRLAESALARGDRAEHNRIMESLSRERIEAYRDRSGLGGPGAPGGGVGGAPDAVFQTWAKRLQTGEVKLSQVPQALRTGVLNASGTILPEKARNTIAEVNAARSILGSLSDLSAKIPRGKGIGRLKAGAQSSVAGFKQTEGLGEDVANYDAMASGMLANISRATGERGVLTNQDIDRVKKNIPTTYDTDTVSRRKLGNLDALFNELQERAIKTYTTDMGNVGATVPASAGGGVIELVRDASGNIVRKP